MNKKAVAILINLAVILILIFVFIDPLWVSIKTLKTGIAKQEQEVKKVEELVAKIQKLEQEYQEIGGDIEKISLALPQEEDLPYLITQFESLASSNGLLLESVKFTNEKTNKETKKKSFQKPGRLNQPEEVSPSSSRLSFEMKLNGSYEGFKEYLRALENNVRLMDVNSIDFSAGQKDGTDLSSLGIFKFGLRVIVYYYQ
jgi:Tfp pilus assembly protein PilO